VSTLSSTVFSGWRNAAGPRSWLHRRLFLLACRVRVAVDRDALDEALANGADPRTAPVLAVRAAQLESARHRRVLARALREVVREATTIRPPLRALTVLYAERQVRADAGAVLALAERLDCPHPACVSGVAIAQRLVTDVCASPLYVVCEPHTLRRRSRRAVAEMSAID
jgi:hypothetical protein